MRNIRLHIEYDGLDFHGWQRQPDGPTIQAHLEDCLEKILGRKTVVYGTSRTDSGVHARCQVANFYVDESVAIGPERWCHVLNFNLPRTIRVWHSSEAPPTFHSQKRVVSKIYEYRLLSRPVASALDRRTYFYARSLDWQAIRQALPYFVGTHDFRSFQGGGSRVLTTTRTLYRFDLDEEYSGLHRFTVEGSGFLKQMVRTMIGTVLEIGEGKRSPDDVPKIIGACDRNAAGRTAPPQGLCLVEIRFEGD